MKKNITILGAGLVGSLLAILLQKRGFKVQIVERRNDMRKNTMSAGKSINLAMSMRGWAALDLAHLRTEIEQIAIPMYGRKIHTPEGEQIFQQYGKNNEAIYSVSRGELNKKLMTLAEQTGVDIVFNNRVTQVDIDTNTLHIEHQQKPITNEIIIGADGAFSSLRSAYLLKDKYNYSQQYIEHGYKELSIPAGNNGTHLLEKNALHIWPRKKFMLIALPNNDGSFTCTLFLPFSGNPSFENITNHTELQHFFQEYFTDALPLMPTLETDFFNNPTSSLITVKCAPWIHEDKSFLIGDAAHAIVPFYGQGMNAGFEDCTVLMNILDNSNFNNWNDILQQYQTQRKPNGDAVAELALQNFIEMRDLVTDKKFLSRKKIEKELGLLFPAQFNSVYEMVSFSHTPYSTAWKCQQAQNHLLENIMALGDFETLKNENSFIQKIQKLMDEYVIAIA